MAKKEGKFRLYNRIWFLAISLVLFILTLWGAADSFLPAALALEQETRCQMEEHVHTDECYVDNVLVCAKKAHTHSESCYLVLLKDNDINTLLTAVDASEDNSLEGVIQNTLTQALAAEGVTTDGNEDLSFVGGIEEVVPSATPTPDTTQTPTPTPTPTTDPSPSTTRGEEDPLPSTTRDEESPQPSTTRSEEDPLPSTTRDEEDPQPSTTRGEEDPQPSTTRGEEDPQPSTTRGDTTEENTETENTETENAVAVLSLTGTSLTALNDTIAENGIEPALTLNTNLYAAEAVAEEINGGIQTYAVGGTPSTGNNAINFYFLLDNKITYVSSGTLTKNDGWRNSYRAYSYANAVSAYKQTNVVTNLSTGNLKESNTTYSFCYNINGEVTSTDNFSGRVTHSTLLRFGNYNTSGTRNALLTSRVWEGGNTYDYPPVPFWTVTLDFSDISNGPDNQVQYVQNNLNSTLTLSGDYDWEFADGTTATASDLNTITETTTLYARPKGNTVTFNSNGGSAVDSQTVRIGSTATRPTDPTRTGYTFAGWYSDKELTTLYDFSAEVTQNITLYAKWTPIPCTITYYNADGTLYHTDTVDYGSSYDLLAAPTGQTWFSGTDIYAGTIDPITGDLELHAGVVAIFSYANGTVVRVPAKPGTVITLRTDGVSSKSLWMDDYGNTHQPGSTYVLNESTVFVEQRPLTIIYKLNFSDSGLDDSDSTPKLAENGLTTATVEIPMGSSAAIYTVTPRTYISATNGEAAHFEGWVPEGSTGTHIEPGTVLTWEVLNQYAEDGVLTLNGDWTRDGTNNITDVRFYVRFDSVAPDVSGSVGSYGTNFYTAQIYHAYAGNAPAHNSGFTIADVTADNSYTADQTIRALVGDKGDSELWISGVPDDEWLFEQLKEFTWENATAAERQNDQYLRIYDEATDTYETVPADELDTDHYSLRWYVFKKEDDGWHIDGRLVKKEGVFKVDKVFGGIEDAMTQARNGFYLLAENGTVTDGAFTPYAESDSNYNAYILTLDQATANALRDDYPNATIQVYGTATNVEGTAVEAWQVNGGEVGETWRFTEMAVLPTYTDNAGQTKNYSWYAEYTLSDSDGEFSQIASFGRVATIPVKTYALDKDPDQGLSLDFTNYYYDNESILIRKIDGDTGLPLGGAEFQLWQGDQQLKFLDGGDGIYSVSPDGTIGSIITNSEGFSVITVDSFSYEKGALVVKEVTAPDGYAVINDVTVDYLNGTNGEAGITDIVGAEPEDYPYHAEYHNENGGILVVKDHAAVLTSVTVNKVWADAVTAEQVTVVLQANGSRATNIFPNLANAEVVLNAANSWTYTWDKLPAYANGELVSWSVKEVKVGTETTMVGSDTFANWIVVYSTPVQTDSDGDGVTDNWAVTVTNTVRRTMLNGIKTSANGGLALSGARFTLTEVQWDAATGQWVDKANANTLVTESGYDGRLLFDGLTAGTFYRLTETEAPSGYLALKAPVYLTVDGMGVVRGASNGAADSATLDTGMVTYTGPYVITIKNIQPLPMPETGGSGTQIYTRTGAALMAAALLLVLYEKRRRREGIPDA